MSYTEIYKFDKKGDAEMIDEVKNAFRGAMAIWQILEKRYLPKYTPSWAVGTPDQFKEYSRTSDFSGGGLKEVWDLYDNLKLSTVDKIVLGTTFDNVLVNKSDAKKVIDAFREFEGETSLNEQADIIEKALNTDDDLIAFAWNQTSVNGDAWESETSTKDEDDEDYYPPYNMLKESKHYDLFEDE